MVLRRLVAKPAVTEELPAHCTTIEAAKRLGLAVRSVQLMVDRGDLQGWKTSGGHRRIATHSVEGWISQRRQQAEPLNAIVAEPVHGKSRRGKGAATAGSKPKPAPSVLVIEDSVHYQKLLSMLIGQRFPEVDLHVATDGVSGLAMCGDLRPDVLIVDILLPGIDGATLITALRSHDQFVGSRLIVVTSLDESQRGPYAFALEGVPVVHKTQLVTELPPLLQRSLDPHLQAAA